MDVLSVLKKLLGPLRAEGRCEAHNGWVVADDIFATPNFTQLIEIVEDKKGTFPI
jgi:hypothetical protein